MSGSVVVPSSTSAAAAERKTSLRVQLGNEHASDVRTANVSVSTPEQRMFDRDGDEPLAARGRCCVHSLRTILYNWTFCI